MKLTKIISLLLVIFLVFGLSGCTKPLPQHSKWGLKDYAETNYGNVVRVVSFEDLEKSNIAVIEDKLGFTYEVKSESSMFNMDGTNFFYMIPSITDNYKDKYFEYLFNIEEVSRFLYAYNLEIDYIHYYSVRLIDFNEEFDKDLAKEYTDELYKLLKEYDEYNLFDVTINILHKDTYNGPANSDYTYIPLRDYN